jgi:hypothetical protein
MNLLIYWKWITGAILILSVLFWAYGNKRYEAGKSEVYQQLSTAPVKIDTVIKRDVIPALPPVIKWLKPEKVFETPPEVQTEINLLADSIALLKSLLAEKAKPFETKMDSARYYLNIITDPWHRINHVNLQLKPVPFDYPEINNYRTIVKDPPWWQLPASIIGGAAIGYGVHSLVNK